jgi:hypothetical protein
MLPSFAFFLAKDGERCPSFSHAEGSQPHRRCPQKYFVQVFRPDTDFKDAYGNFVNVKSNVIAIAITG